MAQAHANARSQDREELPLELRVYGLEGITTTQDEALGKQAVTLADHELRLRAQEVASAVAVTNQTTMQKSLDAVVGELVKTRWTLIGFALTGIGIAFGVH